MHEKDVKFLEDAFKKYYFEHFDLIHTPNNPEMREFGYQKFNSGMNRHISLKSDKELHLMLMKNIPSDVYCSNAKYSFPDNDKLTIYLNLVRYVYSYKYLNFSNIDCLSICIYL